MGDGRVVSLSLAILSTDTRKIIHALVLQTHRLAYTLRVIIVEFENKSQVSLAFVVTFFVQIFLTITA